MITFKTYSLLGSLMLLTLPLWAETIALSDFTAEGLSGWTEKSFYGQTRYTLVERNGGKVLAAESQNSASALFKKIRVDLEKTPYLNWSWLVVNNLGDINERQKKGDDYSARVYVVISGGVFFWRARAINYVWSSNESKETTWPNAYTDNARMIALESGREFLGQWRTEKKKYSCRPTAAVW